MKAFKAGLLIDGVSNEPISEAIVLVENGEISAVGPQEEIKVPDEAEIKDFSGQVLIPGLIDAHVHVGGWRTMDELDWMTDDISLATARATVDLRKLVEAGFTSIRDMGSRTGVGLRKAVAEGSIQGPRIFTSGLGISQTGGFSDPQSVPREWALTNGNGISKFADGPEDCRKTVRKRLRQNVDLIKIWTSGGVYSETNPGTSIEFTPAEVKSMTEEAHRAGIQVASHAHGAEGIRMAVENGVDTIEHGTYLDEEGCQLMCENDAILVPTFSLAYRYANVGAEHGVTSEVVEMSTEVVEDRITATKNAYEYDVDIAFGTDFCGPEIVPHGTNAMEARLLVDEVGMDEMDVIKSATSVAGRTLPASNVGTIEPGKYADLLVLEENPVNDITELERVNEVYVSGERQNAI